MDDKHSAILWQLMQSFGSANLTQEDAPDQLGAGQPQLEHTLQSLKPLMSPKQQLLIDLMTKMQEIKILMHEIQHSGQ